MGWSAKNLTPLISGAKRIRFAFSRSIQPGAVRKFRNGNYWFSYIFGKTTLGASLSKILWRYGVQDDPMSSYYRLVAYVDSEGPLDMSKTAYGDCIIAIRGSVEDVLQNIILFSIGILQKHLQVPEFRSRRRRTTTRRNTTTATTLTLEVPIWNLTSAISCHASAFAAPCNQQIQST